MSLLAHIFTNPDLPAGAANSHRVSARIGTGVEIFSRERVASLAMGLQGISESTFDLAIPYVLKMCSYFQVIGIKARRVIAKMKNFHLGVNWQPSKSQSNEPVDPHNSTLEIYAAVAVGIFSSAPYPAFTCHAKSLPQKFTLNWVVRR
jgi:hypothetical protein